MFVFLSFLAWLLMCTFHHIAMLKLRLNTLPIKKQQRHDWFLIYDVIFTYRNLFIFECVLTVLAVCSTQKSQKRIFLGRNRKICTRMLC